MVSDFYYTVRQNYIFYIIGILKSLRTDFNNTLRHRNPSLGYLCSELKRHFQFQNALYHPRRKISVCFRPENPPVHILYGITHNHKIHPLNLIYNML